MEKVIFEAPKIEIVDFNTTDVITSSPEPESEPP